jgi:23S rRNA maturation mini-RNase III
MTQIEILQARIQVEATRELVEMARPMFQKIVRRVRSLRSANSVSEAVQPEVIPSVAVETLIGYIQTDDAPVLNR